MDLINQLAGTLGVDANAATALAGGVLGQVKGQLAEKEGAEAAEQLDSAVPELGDWAAEAQGLLGGGDSDAAGGLGGMLGGALGGGGGGLLGAAASAVGGNAGSIAALLPLVSKLGLDTDTLIKAAPIVLKFLGDRVSPELLAKVQGLIPGMEGGAAAGGDAEGGDAGGLGGMLGGLLG